MLLVGVAERGTACLGSLLAAHPNNPPPFLHGEHAGGQSSKVWEFLKD